MTVLSRPESPPTATRLAPSHRVVRTVVRLLGLVLVVVVAGNAAIALVSLIARTVTPPAAVPGVTGVDNLSMVDEQVWRGAAPNLVGYQSLRNAGVTTVVDLRAETEATALDGALVGMGLRVVHLPVRDGQTPSHDQIDAFMTEVEESEGVVFVHCGAGVGRTGSMVGAYVVNAGGTTGVEAVAGNLSVGPPSLEQLAFTAGLRPGEDIKRPPLAVVALSRLLDAPRRLMSVLDL